MATSLVAEQKRQEKEVNDAIVEKGRMEMQQLYQSGNLDPQAYLNIASKYGNDNPDVYAALKSCISTYVSIRTGGSSGGGGAAAVVVVVVVVAVSALAARTLRY